MAFSKLPITPSRSSLRITRTGNPAPSAKRPAISRVSSLDWSSHTITSSGKRSCEANESSCSCRNRAPL